MMKQKVLITGATGFVGKNLLPFLDHDQYDFTLLSRNPEKLPEASGFSVVVGDLNDLESLKKAFAGHDILVNLAAEVRNSAKLTQTNVAGTYHLVEAVKHSGISKIIHLSSVGVVGKSYSRTDYRVDESETPAPRNLYEQTKLESEEILLNENRNDYQLVILRPTNVFGEMHPFNALNNLMVKVQQRKLLLASKEAKVNYVYVGDLCQAITFFLAAEKPGGIFQVGDSMNLNDFYRLIAKKLQVKARIFQIPGLLCKLLEAMGITRLRVVTNQVIYDDSRLKNEIGAYHFGINRGLDLTIDYFRKHNWLK